MCRCALLHVLFLARAMCSESGGSNKNPQSFYALKEDKGSLFLQQTIGSPEIRD